MMIVVAVNKKTKRLAVDKMRKEIKTYLLIVHVKCSVFDCYSSSKNMLRLKENDQ